MSPFLIRDGFRHNADIRPTAFFLSPREAIIARDFSGSTSIVKNQI